EVRVMGDTGRALGGGDISAFEGSFSHDDIQYRVRSIVGAAGIDASAVAVSLGTGQDTGNLLMASTNGPAVNGPAGDAPTAVASTTGTSGKSPGSTSGGSSKSTKS